MLFTATKLPGAYVIELQKIEDNRGFFARAWCQREFAAHGLNSNAGQCNISFNPKKGTLRGMHYQVAPYAEAKLIRCIQGAIYDVIIDLRPVSPTYMQWIGIELTADNRKMLYIPEDFAHGYQTLCDNTEVFYQVSQFYQPGAERGVRWNDPAFGIVWPETEHRLLSIKDQNWQRFVSSSVAHPQPVSGLR
jgi:dTDP-4-dehydrorhamnose 3,5-epimerase